MSPPRIHRVVVDASVVIKWFVNEPGTERAQSLAEQAADGELELNAPDLCLVECANVIWKLLTKRHTLTKSQGKDAISWLAGIPLLAVPSKDLIAPAYRLAVSTGVTVYDGMYLALGEALDAPVITADRKMVNRLKGTPHEGRAELL